MPWVKKYIRATPGLFAGEYTGKVVALENLPESVREELPNGVPTNRWVVGFKGRFYAALRLYPGLFHGRPIFKWSDSFPVELWVEEEESSSK